MTTELKIQIQYLTVAADQPPMLLLAVLDPADLNLGPAGTTLVGHLVAGKLGDYLLIEVPAAAPTPVPPVPVPGPWPQPLPPQPAPDPNVQPWPTEPPPETSGDAGTPEPSPNAEPGTI